MPPLTLPAPARRQFTGHRLFKGDEKRIVHGETDGQADAHFDPLYEVISVVCNKIHTTEMTVYVCIFEM